MLLLSAVLKNGERITETESFVVHTEDGQKVWSRPFIYHQHRHTSSFISASCVLPLHGHDIEIGLLVRSHPGDRRAVLQRGVQRSDDLPPCPACLLEWRSKKVILATGVRDLIPDIEGFDRCEQCAGPAFL